MAFENIKESVEGAVAAENLTNAQFTVVTNARDAIAFVDAGGAEPYALVNNQDLTLRVNGGPTQTVVFKEDDFVDIGNATAQEVANAILVSTSGLNANVFGGVLQLSVSQSSEGPTTLQVTGGTANAVLAFSTALQTGTLEGGVESMNTAGAANGADHLGVLQNNPNTGEAAMVAVSGRTKLLAGGPVAAGDLVSLVGSTGRAVVAGAGHYTIGMAVTPALGDGALFTVDLNKFQQNP